MTSSAGRTSAGPTSAGRTSAGPTSAARTSAARTSAGPTSAAPTATGPTPAPPLGAGISAVLGFAAALVGLLPWAVTGARLPLQNLWADSSQVDRMPHVVLPFSQYEVSFIIAMLVVGLAAAGLTARVTRARHGRWTVLGLLAGCLGIQVAGAIQTTLVVAAGLRGGVYSLIYLVACVGVVAAGILVGLVVFALVALAPPAGAVIGLSLAAVALGSWAAGLLHPITSVTANPAAALFGDLPRWLPAVGVGAAIAWAGIAGRARVAAALGGLGILWLLTALITAITYAAGSRVLLPRPVELVAALGQVFGAAATTPMVALPPLVVAVVVAGVGLIVRRRAGPAR